MLKLGSREVDEVWEAVSAMITAGKPAMPRTFGKNMRIDTGTNLVSLSASLALLLAPTSKT